MVIAAALDLKRHIRTIPDFPKPGILFRDITPLLLDSGAFHRTVDMLADRYRGGHISKIVSIEARGFILGSALADRIGAGFVPVRKPGRLPAETIGEAYTLEYGENVLEMHRDAIRPGDPVIVLDDLLATGGTAAAAARLVDRCGGTVREAAFLIELARLGGRRTLEPVPVFSILAYDE